MKTAKILGLIAGALVLLVVLALIGVWLFVNPNNFKPRIAAAVKDATGRELVLSGDISLSVFPWIALKLGPASLSSPPSFKGAPFLSFNTAQVRVKLLPLLSKELQIDRVELDGVDLTLLKDDKGHGNWEMSEATGKPPKAAQAPQGGGPALESVAGIKVTHGKLTYDPYLVQDFDLETGAIGAHRAIPVTLSLNASRGIAGEQFLIKAKLSAENDDDTWHVTGLDLSGTWTRARQPDVKLDLSAAVLDANLDKQTVSLPAFALSLAEAKLTGKLQATHITGERVLEGEIALAPLNLRDFAPHFGVTLPKTTDAHALTALSLGARFGYDPKGATLDNVNLKLDDTTLKGRIQVALAKATAVKFELGADSINLDRYRPPADATPDPKSPAADKPAPKKADAGEPLIASGVFTLGAVHAAGLDLSHLSVTVDMQDDVTHLHPLAAQLYGGRYAGDLTYDARTATPALSMDEHLSQVDVAQLVANTKAKGRVSGKATVNIKGTARGAEADAIMKTLNGHFDANLSEGAIEGLDLGYELAMAQALLAKQTSSGVPNEKRTKFDAFKMSAAITNGVAETKDLSIISAVLKVAGQGTVNLPTSGVDLTLVTSLMKSASTTAVDIPLKVTGTYTDPKVRPDLEGVAKQAVKQKLNDVLKKNGVDLNNLFKH